MSNVLEQIKGFSKKRIEEHNEKKAKYDALKESYKEQFRKEKQKQKTNLMKREAAKQAYREEYPLEYYTKNTVKGAQIVAGGLGKLIGAGGGATKELGKGFAGVQKFYANMYGFSKPTKTSSHAVNDIYGKQPSKAELKRLRKLYGV